jgi:hypothetical protein
MRRQASSAMHPGIAVVGLPSMRRPHLVKSARRGGPSFLE